MQQGPVVGVTVYAWERVVVIRHAIKNALIPVVTLIGLQLPILVGVRTVADG